MKARLERAAARGLIAADEVRRTRPHFFRHDEGVTINGGRPTTVVAAVAHWRDSAAPAATALVRRRYLAACVESILGLDVDHIVVAVLTNDPQQVAEGLALDLVAAPVKPTDLRMLENAGSFRPPFDERRQIFSIGWSPGRFVRAHGFFLTWGHKAVFRRALRDPKVSLLIYLEDDIRFTDELLAYWLRFREPLSDVGLLPAFVRYEERDGVRYVVDQLRRQVVRPGIRLPGHDDELVFAELENPYQGMYIFDRALANRHFRYSPYREPFRSAHVGNWCIRERAAAGPIFDDVPEGFRSRNVVPVRESARGPDRLDPMCLMEHMGRTYVDRQDSPHGKVRVEDLFEATS